MPVLKDEVKFYITQCLACYDVPSQVVESVKEEFGLTLERSHVQAYDPYKSAGKDLSNKFKLVFDATRKAFLDDISKIPIASQSFRLRSLQRSYDWFTSKKNYVAANQVLEQAAKEVGGFYTNKLKVSDADGNPFKVLLEQFSGGSLPIVQEIDAEFEEVKPEPKKVAKKPTWNNK